MEISSSLIISSFDIRRWFHYTSELSTSLGKPINNFIFCV